MKCPYGSSHRATWRCFAVYGLDWLLGHEWMPDWVDGLVIRAILLIDPYE